ncbi:flavin reductase family protein [Pararhizobium mangrovi]|uniref:Flavin reductase family protein n=1 Tax=Pararhizobium mangrovi TaxID=2590452 RepID=A0A506UC17_9HYPH|nr:flavin reductase family protein [Pararhizobium mangrovi]TPW30199.1 flavin reductase family protein [Pararhizobium mangrovi]
MNEGDQPERMTGAMTSAARFKLGMRTLVGSVNVVALQGHDGRLLGVTATAVCSLSADPPSLVVCINRSSTIAPALEIGKTFSVSVLSQHQQNVADAFGGRKGLAGRNRFVHGEWYRSEEDVPLLADARACLECRVESFMDYGTHRVTIAAVADVHLGDIGDASLIFADGAYHMVG